MFGMFTPKAPAQPAAQPANPASGQPAANGQPAVPNSGGMPGAPNPNAGAGAAPGGEGGGADGSGTGTGSPLDSFSDIFKMDDKNQPAPDPMKEKLMNLDTAKLAQAVSKMNFAQNVSAELAQKALGGDVQSFMQALNQVSQNAFAMSTNMVVNMMENAISKNNERFGSTLPEKFRSFSLANEGPKNPALNHPAAKPMLDAMKSMIAAKNPGMPPAVVASKAEEYFTAFGSMMGAVQDSNKAGSNSPEPEADWTKFLVQ